MLRKILHFLTALLSLLGAVVVLVGQLIPPRDPAPTGGQGPVAAIQRPAGMAEQVGLPNRTPARCSAVR